MFEATWAVGCALGGWPATGSLDGVPVQSGLPGHGQPRGLAQRNEASIRLG